MAANSKITPFEDFCLHRNEAQFHAFAGAMGGFVSGVVTCPLDVIKTKLQAQGGFVSNGNRHVLYRGFMDTGRAIWREDGLRGFYKGLGPIVMGYIPTWSIYFMVYDKAKEKVSKVYPHPVLVSMVSSVIAGGTSTVVTNPIWVIKTRLMSQTSGKGGQASPWHYKSTLDAVRQMWRTEGFRAFYSGLTPALLGLTHVAVQFPTYEYLRKRFTGQEIGKGPEKGADRGHHSLGILSATILSKIAASTATYPHEVIRTRLQTQRRPNRGTEGLSQGIGVVGESHGHGEGANGALARNGGGLKYRGIIKTFQIILREEGPWAFYAGLGTNMFRAVPAAAVTMFTYETLMSWFSDAKRSGAKKLEEALAFN